MKLEDLRRELRKGREDRASAWVCPGCGGYGKPLGATEGKFTMASFCEGCDCVFGWKRTHIPIPPPSNEIELGDKITALNDRGETVTGVVVEMEIGRDIGMRSFPDGTSRLEDRGPRNHRAKIVCQSDEIDMYEGPLMTNEWVQLQGAFIVQKSAGI